MLSKLNKVLILAYEKGYRVVNGKVISPFNNKPLKIYTSGNRGYYQFGLHLEYVYKIDVHRLVAYQKYGDKIFEDGIQVRHLDGNQKNNSEDNITIGTQSDNMMDKPKEQRQRIAINASKHIRKFTDNEVKEIREDHKKSESYKVVMEKWGIKSKGTLHHILNNKYITSK